MIALILILILVAVTIFTALLESFYTPEDLSKMGIRLDYSPTGRSAGNPPTSPANSPASSPTSSPAGRRSARPDASQETPTRPHPQTG